MNDLLDKIEKLGIDKNLILEEYNKEQIRRLSVDAKYNYLSYLKLTNPEYMETRHGVYMAKKVQEAVELSKDGRIQIMCFNVPPQHGKSLTITEALPSWFLLKYPNKNVLALSYNADTAVKFGKKNRDKIRKCGNIFGHTLARGSSSMTEFGLEGYDGYIKSTGIEGSVTSRKGDLIIIDDPYKNLREASSGTVRRNVESAFDSAIKTRLHPGSIVILIMNRWHEDDIVEYTKKVYGDKVDIISFPAQCVDEGDLLGREIGEYLWPEHHSEEFYESQKYNTFVWESQYQQNPKNAVGGEYNPDEFNTYDFNKILLTDGTININLFDDLAWGVDGASKKGSKNDYSSFLLVGRIKDRYMILFRDKGKYDIVELTEKAERYFNKYPCRKIIEDKNSGTQLIQILENKGMKNIIPQKADKSTGGKEIRAQYILPLLRKGQLYVPYGQDWLEEFYDEVRTFPYGVHDDEFDNLVQIITEMDTRYMQSLAGRAVVADKPSIF